MAGVETINYTDLIGNCLNGYIMIHLVNQVNLNVKDVDLDAGQGGENQLHMYPGDVL